MRSFETPLLNADVFDNSFFTDYDRELANVDAAEQASVALAGILTIENADGTQKTYEQIKTETQTFFANKWVQDDEAVLNRMAAEFTQACMAHPHGTELAQENQLGTVFKTGLDSLSDHAHSTEKDEYEIDPVTGKKRKKKRGWFGVYK